MLSIVPLSGCNSIRERIESNRAEREEEEKYKFDTDKDFLNFYRREITNSLRKNDKSALRSLFCETVIENTDDLDEGISYIFDLEDWDQVDMLRSNSSAYKEFNSGEHFTFVSAWVDIEEGDTQYRIYFSGFASYYVEVKSISQFSKENTGLTNLLICELDENNKPVEQACYTINGIYYPGRQDIENIVDTVFNTYSSTNDDGSYIDTMTDEALESIMSPELLKSADKDELEAFIRLIRYGYNSKEHNVFFFMNEKNGSYILSTVIHLGLDDRSIAIIVRDGLIDGAVISEETDPVTPKSGEIEGFSDLVD